MINGESKHWAYYKKLPIKLKKRSWICLQIFLKYTNFNFIFTLFIIHILLKYPGFEHFRTNWFHFFLQILSKLLYDWYIFLVFQICSTFRWHFWLEKIMILICPFNMFFWGFRRFQKSSLEFSETFIFGENIFFEDFCFRKVQNNVFFIYIFLDLWTFKYHFLHFQNISFQKIWPHWKIFFPSPSKIKNKKSFQN